MDLERGSPRSRALDPEAGDLDLTADDLAAITTAATAIGVHGNRCNDAGIGMVCL